MAIVGLAEDVLIGDCTVALASWERDITPLSLQIGGDKILNVEWSQQRIKNLMQIRAPIRDRLISKSA